MRFSLLFFFFIFCYNLFAQQKQLTLYTKNGEVKIYQFRDKPVVKKNDDNLILKTNNMEVVYPLKNLRKFTIMDTFEEIPSTIIINDDEIVDYTNYSDIEDCDITYIRTFLDTCWQPLFVPFELSYSQLSDEFEIAIINNFHHYDDDNDGVFDRSELEICKVTTEHILLPNYPYLIKAKSLGTKYIYTYGATLYATEPFSIDCSSVEMKYKFRGTYNQIDSLRTLGYYVLEDGFLKKKLSDKDVLSSFRWYMSVQPRNEQFKSNEILLNQNQLRVFVVNENKLDEFSVERNTKIIPVPLDYFGVTGSRILKPSQHGIYIMRMSDGSSIKMIK